MTWGTDQYGGEPYGGGGGPFDVVAAWAQTAQTIRVRYSSRPRVRNDRNAADALTRGNYALSVLSHRTTDAPPAPPTILTVRQIDNTTVELLLAGELHGASVTYQLTIAGTVENISGTTVGIRRGDFTGLNTARTREGGAVAAAQATGPTDIAFNPTALSALGGAFRFTPEGDVDLTEGPDTIRKLIYRRVILPKGSIAWRPDYGFNPGWHSLVRAGRQAEHESDIERQVLQEPEVGEVNVTIRHFVGRGIVFADIDAELRSGLGLDPFSVPIQGGA